VVGGQFRRSRVKERDHTLSLGFDRGPFTGAFLDPSLAASAAANVTAALVQMRSGETVVAELRLSTRRHWAAIPLFV
jgi:hypothetical protein